YYDWYAGSYYEYYNKNPNDILPWEVFKYAQENGVHLFDFGGAGHPNQSYGVRDYKQKFGGNTINTGRFIRVNKPFVYMIGKLGLKIWKLLR
ncbi:MAG: peptidoglycan bridge formation glycyltransferase FemA/FemB family protein, partial [Candidatus Delongbacteria bacterium]|nr:peptidoglycan bridge formation glycyltransferase FemA/FemB family protein [Candidatus Delongbacteria bacterium]